MNNHFGACVQNVHHQYAHMILDGYATGQPSLHQAFSQVIDVTTPCFMHALMYNTQNK